MRLHPQSLLWMPDEASPAAQHLSMLGLPETLIKRVGRSFPALYRLASADNLEAIVIYLQQEISMDEAALHRMIGKFPQLLGLSFESNVRPTVACLV